MSKLSREDILKLAKLSRLELTEEEIAHFQEEISAILQYVEQLQSVDLDNLEPTAQVSGLTNVTRPDEVADYGYATPELMKNAPKTKDDHFKVKRMVG